MDNRGRDRRGFLVGVAGTGALLATPAAQRYGPAREGPPLILVKHAFLI